MAEPRTDETTRRSFIRAGAAIGAGVFAGSMLACRGGSANQASAGHTLPPLPYPPDALEPAIDGMTMQIHHGKHHQAYVDNLNNALKAHPDLQQMPLEKLLARNAASVPEDIRQVVINNGGGHLNHSLFWTILGPSSKVSHEPKGKLLEAVKSAFGSVDDLKQKMNDAGTKRFGSGWAWLVKDSGGKLEILSSANQDTPILQGKVPVLGIDVWEHAYYLKYQNRRPDYLKAIWSVVNWDEVGRRYEA